MKSVIKKVMVIALICLAVTVVFQTSFSTYNASALVKTMDTDNIGQASGAEKGVQHIVDNIVVIARIVGVCVAVGMLIVLGMKYMTAAPSEKADIKKSAVVYVVGALLLFGVVGILGILSSFSKNIT